MKDISSSESGSISGLDVALHDLQARRARADLKDFSSALGYENNWHHNEWYDLLMQLAIKKFNRCLLLAPRGHAKSTCVTVNYPLWMLGNNPNLRIIIASDTVSQASLFLRQISHTIEHNKSYHDIYGHLKPDIQDKWTDTEVIVKRDQNLKDASLLALGVGSATIGRRADLIICDDIVSEDNCATELQREKLKTWFYKVLMPVLDPDGAVIVVGTRWHYHDLYSELLEKPQYTQKVYKAIEKGKALWPARFSLKKLEEIKNEIGSIIFNCQYLNDPSGLRGQLLKLDWLQYYDVAPPDMRIYQGVDLAISERAEADYTVICTIGVDAQNNIYVLDFYRDKLSFPMQVKAIHVQAEIHKPLKIAIESNAYQKAMSQQLRQMSMLPVVETKTTKDKITRMIALSPHFENGRIRIKKDMTELIDEYLKFPRGEHDDMLDALEIAVRSAAISPGSKIFTPLERPKPKTPQALPSGLRRALHG